MLLSSLTLELKALQMLQVIISREREDPLNSARSLEFCPRAPNILRMISERYQDALLVLRRFAQKQETEQLAIIGRLSPKALKTTMLHFNGTR
jgi:hypothetical protein